MNEQQAERLIKMLVEIDRSLVYIWATIVILGLIIAVK
jgi:hypothetical protein